MKTRITIITIFALTILFIVSSFVFADIGPEMIHLNPNEKVYVLCVDGDVEIIEYDDHVQVHCHPKQQTFLPAVVKEQGAHND